jgi:hypothetical protein
MNSGSHNILSVCLSSAINGYLFYLFIYFNFFKHPFKLFGGSILIKEFVFFKLNILLRNCQILSVCQSGFI